MRSLTFYGFSQTQRFEVDFKKIIIQNMLKFKDYFMIISSLT